MAHHSATGDSRIIPALTRHYQSNTSAHCGSKNVVQLPDARDVCNVETILWLYGKTGNRFLLDHAIQAYETYNRLLPDDDTTLNNLLSDKRATEHGVTYNEIGKLGAILYQYTGDATYLNATINAYRKMDRDQMLVDGVPSSNEHLRGKDPLDSHETCDIADYTWGAGYLLLTTGLAEYADKIERACFNAAPGAVRSDFKGLQYFSCPNQVIADASSNHNLLGRGHSPLMSYRPIPATECCTGDVNRIMPNYAARMWLTDGEGGLVAALYGPSQVTVKVGAEGQEVTVVEKTDYPFSERIDFEVRAAAPTTFTMWLRIPGWCRSPQALVNAQPYEQGLSAGSFIPITRQFRDQDRITLILPMEIKVERWPREGISVERGPLAYALRIEEDWQVDPQDPRSTADFPAWNLYAASRWNYALAIHIEQPEKDIEIIHKPDTLAPWSIHTAPIELRLPARRVLGWRIVRKDGVFSGYHEGRDGSMKKRKLTGKFAFTPELPNPETLSQHLGRKIEMVTLVPYGCTKLRITIFPHQT
jgi:hypothetical protein